jgi:hypothetical protein
VCKEFRYYSKEEGSPKALFEEKKQMLPYSLQKMIKLNKTTLWQVSALGKVRYAKNNARNHGFAIPDLHIFEIKNVPFKPFGKIFTFFNIIVAILSTNSMLRAPQSTSTHPSPPPQHAARKSSGFRIEATE